MKKIIVFLTALILCAFSAMGQPGTNSNDNPATETAPTINPQDSKDKQAGSQGSTETAPTINPPDSKDNQAGSQVSDTGKKDADAKGTNGGKSNQTTTPQKTKQKQQKTKTTPPNEQQNTGSNDNAQNDSDADTSGPVAPTPSKEEGSNTGPNSDTNTYKELISSLEHDLETERDRFRKISKISITLGVIAGLLLIILIIVLVLKKKADAQTLGSQTELQGMIDDLEDKVQGLTKEKEELESQKSNWEREKRSLEQELTGLRNKKAPVAPIAPSPKPAPPQPQSLYADAIVNGKFNRVKEQPDPAETNFELRLDSPTATSAKIYIYSGAERRILANPAFLEGCDKQILGNSRVETTHPGLAQKEGENNWVVTKKPEVIIR